jgi:hypothetical protein
VELRWISVKRGEHRIPTLLAANPSGTSFYSAKFPLSNPVIIKADVFVSEVKTADFHAASGRIYIHAKHVRLERHAACFG